MSSHRVAHPVAHATHLASRVPHHVTRLHCGRDACRWVVSAGALLLAGCGGPQSALDPAGRGAERIAELFWWMAAGAVIIWLAVVGLAIYAMRARPGAHSRGAALLIIGGGAVLPTVVLAGLLAYGLALMPELLTPAAEGQLQIAVSGEQWWWRVRYLTPAATARPSNSPTRSACPSVHVWRFTWRAPTSSTRSGFRPSAARST